MEILGVYGRRGGPGGCRARSDSRGDAGAGERAARGTGRIRLCADGLDGSVVRLSENKGRVVLINFWATWCVPCLYELPHVQKLYERYRNKGLTVLAISTDFDRARVKPFVRKNGYTFPVLFADPGVQSDYEVRSIPTTYLIDGKGRLRFMQMGYGPDTGTELEWALEQLLGR